MSCIQKEIATGSGSLLFLQSSLSVQSIDPLNVIATDAALNYNAEHNLPPEKDVNNNKNDSLSRVFIKENKILCKSVSMSK